MVISPELPHSRPSNQPNKRPPRANIGHTLAAAHLVKPAWLLKSVSISAPTKAARALNGTCGTARAVEPSDPDYERLWKIVNENNRDRYTAYQKQTTRPIPVIAVTPRV